MRRLAGIGGRGDAENSSAAASVLQVCEREE
jgi:hypothetical protein